MTILDYLEKIADIAGYALSLMAVCALLFKPIRDKLFGFTLISNGMKCILRSDMLGIYYQHHKQNALRQYEMENFHKDYEAYKALGGNSFIDDIYKEVRTWEVND